MGRGEQEVHGGRKMKRSLGAFATAGPLLVALCATEPALAQKAGGIVKIGLFDSPASMSLHEEATIAVNRPMMGVFNNLVMFRQDVPQNSMKSIVPDLATSWAWNEEGTELTFPLRQGIKWHDGKPCTAKDVKCTWDLLTGKSDDKLRLNPRNSWYSPRRPDASRQGQTNREIAPPIKKLTGHEMAAAGLSSTEKPRSAKRLTRRRACAAGRR